MLRKEFQKLFSIEDNPFNFGFRSKPNKLSENVFSSFRIGKRLDSGKLQNTFIFNITEVTVYTMKYILQYDREKFLITGKGGTGKSMALILYPTIFNSFVEPFLLANDLSIL